MVHLDTFLLFISCAFSLIAVVFAERARIASKKIPEVPAKAFQRISQLEAALDSLDNRFQGHCKREAAEKGNKAKQERSHFGGNGSSAEDDYAVLDRRMLGL